jgi:hypothetical protein
MEMLDRVKTVKEREEALDEMTVLMDNCHSCTLRGRQQFDRVLECCKTCPTQKSIEFVRFRLDKTLRELREMRDRSKRKPWWR